MAYGRPTLLTPALIERAEEYLKCWADEGDVIPSVAGLSLYLGVNRSSIQLWGKGGNELTDLFSGTLDKLHQLQERITVNKGLTGDFTPAISKLVLHNHGYSDKAESTNTLQGPKGEPLAWEILPVAPKVIDEA